MKAAGHELDAHVLQHLLHVYCHNGMWGEALQVLSDVAAGRLGQSSTSTAASASKPQLSTGVRKQATDNAAAADSRTIDNDRLWHVVLRKLWEKRASDELLNEFLQHMSPAQVLRFKLLYGMQAIPGEQGRYTLQVLEDWQLPLQLQAQLQQQQQQQQQQQLDAPEQLQKLPNAQIEPGAIST
jgi:pentatricopeptide repeat protein